MKIQIKTDTVTGELEVNSPVLQKAIELKGYDHVYNAIISMLNIAIQYDEVYEEDDLINEIKSLAQHVASVAEARLSKTEEAMMEKKDLPISENRNEKPTWNFWKR